MDAPVCAGEILHVTIPPPQPVAVSVTLVPVQVLGEEDVIVGGKSALTFTTKALLITTQGGLVQVNV